MVVFGDGVRRSCKCADHRHARAPGPGAQRGSIPTEGWCPATLADERDRRSGTDLSPAKLDRTSGARQVTRPGARPCTSSASHRSRPSFTPTLQAALGKLIAVDDEYVSTYAARALKNVMTDDSMLSAMIKCGLPKMVVNAIQRREAVECTRELMGCLQNFCWDRDGASVHRSAPFSLRITPPAEWLFHGHPYMSCCDLHPPARPSTCLPAHLPPANPARTLPGSGDARGGGATHPSPGAHPREDGGPVVVRGHPRQLVGTSTRGCRGLFVGV